MERNTEIETTAREEQIREKLLAFLRARNRRARFLTELYAAMARAQIGSAEVDRALAELEAARVVMVRDHFCADPHLAGVDLRVAALVESREGADPQLSAIRVIDEAWNRWLSEYLANHRCG